MTSQAELGNVGLRAGANYLVQSQSPRSVSLAVPAPCGAVLVRTTDGAIEVSAEACKGDSTTVLCLARSPAAPEWLALATSSPTGGCVQVWKLPNRTDVMAATATLSHTLELEQSHTCRQLSWHPHRRVLAAALPDKAHVFELGGPAARDGPVRHELARPEKPSGAMSACCWGESGGVLACLCEGEVLLYTWGLLGASWAHHSCSRHRVADRRLCAILPLVRSAPLLMTNPPINDDDDDDDDAAEEADMFVIGMGTPIATASAADISSADGATRTLTGASAGGGGAESANDSGVMDLRGRIGGGAPMGRSNLLDLSAELEAARPPAALRDALGDHRAAAEGALLLCGGGADGTVDLGLASRVSVATPQPDLLAHAARTTAAGLLVAASSSSARLILLSCDLAARTLAPRGVLELPDGFRTRGLAFDLVNTSVTLHTLGGRRAKQSVVFSSPRAEQQLLLCSFGEAELSRAQQQQQQQQREPKQSSGEAAETAAAPMPSSGNAPTPMVTASVAGVAIGSASAGGASAGMNATSTLGALLGGLQAHLDGRFASIDAAIARLDTRLGAVEAKQERYEQHVGR